MQTKTKLEMPTKHLNGGDWERLGKQYAEVLSELEVLKEKIQAVEFHSRDYYVNGDGSFRKAVIEWQNTMKHLSKVVEYYEAHAEHVFSH